MASGKKTFNVEEFKKYVNEQLAREDEFATQEFKAGICMAWHEIAHKTGNYKGYQHIFWIKKGGWEAWRAAGEPDFPEKNQYITGSKDLSESYARIYY